MNKTKRKDGIEYGFSYDRGILRVWESEDNPHGVNFESSCFLAEIQAKNENANRALSLIESYFGKETLSAFMEFISKT